MNNVSQELLNEIRNSVDLTDIVSSYISLTPRGKNYFGICPFHDDNRPSMSVSKDKQIYKCFSEIYDRGLLFFDYKPFLWSINSQNRVDEDEVETVFEKK